MKVVFDLSKPVAIGSDHAGFAYKEYLISFLEGKNIPFTDFGTHSADSVDYPDFAHPVASAVETGSAAFGILLCGSANGVAITANKHQGIRAAICWGVELAQLARLHNDANIVALGTITNEITIRQILDKFLNTEFEGGRHQKRLDKIAEMENQR